MPSNDIKLKSKTVEKDKLGFLGEDFQYRLVSVFMRDTKYFKHLERVIEQDKFTVPELRMITGIMKDYYHEFDVVPSYEILLIKLREKTRDDLQMEMYIEIVDKLQGMSSEGEDYTKELGSKFFIQQHFLGIAKKIIDICKNGSLDKFEDCQALIESAGSYSQNAPDACSPFEDIEGIFTREDTMTIPTGIDKLDDILNGGLDKGNIGLIIGPSGFGKTSLTTSFGAYAATCRLPENRNNGFKVLQIVFEDKIADIGRKYASNITQVETRFIGKDVDRTTQAKDTLLSSDKYTLIKDNVKVMRLETNEYTATDIKNVIKSVINGGFYPVMVIVDYLDCIKPERGTEKLQSHEHQNITMRKFENYAKELNVALWLPTQSNREGFDADDLGMKHIQGSVGRGQIAQVVIGIGRQSTDISQNRAVLKIMKNRSGQAGIILNVYFNNGTSTVYCDNNIDFGSDDDFSI